MKGAGRNRYKLAEKDIIVMKLFQLIGLALVLRLYQAHRTQLLSVCVAIG